MIECIHKYNDSINKNIIKDKNLKLTLNLKVYYISIDIDYDRLYNRYLKYYKNLNL